MSLSSDRAVVVSPNRKLALPTCLALASLMAPFLGSGAHGETWTALEGDRSIEAELVGLWNDTVILDMGGRRVSVPMNALRSDSRIQARAMWDRIQDAREARVQELQGQATAAAAPAPSPLPEPPSAPPYQAPLAGAGVSDYLQHIDDQLAAGHAIVVYDSLPPSYRRDIDEFVSLAASKINPATWQAVTTGVHQLGDLLVTRQNWFFSNPRIEALPSDQLDALQQRLLLVSGMLRVGFTPEAMQLSKLQSMPFSQWLTERDQAVAPYVSAIMRQSDAGTGRSFSVVSEDAEKAVVKMRLSTDEQNVEFTNVEGYWVPAETAKNWSEDMASLKLEVQDAPAGTYLADKISNLAILQPMLLPLASSSDARDFHSAMETMRAGMQDKIASVASTLGMSLASNDRRGSRGGYDDGYDEGYGDEYGEDYDEMMEEEMDEDYETETRSGGR